MTRTDWMMRALLVAALAVAGVIAGEAQDHLPTASPVDLVDAIDNVRVPLQKHENGRVKALLRARKATLPPTGIVEAEGVRVELFDELGVLDGIMTAENATIDQRRGRGRGTGAVRFEHRGVSIEGIGITWASNESLIRIESNAVVQLEREGQTLLEGWK
jgi:hypothetical protein